MEKKQRGCMSEDEQYEVSFSWQQDYEFMQMQRKQYILIAISGKLDRMENGLEDLNKRIDEDLRNAIRR